MTTPVILVTVSFWSYTPSLTSSTSNKIGIENRKRKTSQGCLTHAGCYTHHGCYSERSPLPGCPGHSTPWLGNDNPDHTPWCPLGPSCPADPPCGCLQEGCSLTSCPQAVHCICYMGSTESHSVDTSGGFYTAHAFCFCLKKKQKNICKYWHRKNLTWRFFISTVKWREWTSTGSLAFKWQQPKLVTATVKKKKTKGPAPGTLEKSGGEHSHNRHHCLVQ